MISRAATPLKVLLIDDSAAEAGRILGSVRRSGYDPTHKQVSTMRALKSALARESWDVVVATLTNSRVNTLIELAKRRKSGEELPCVLLCGKNDENDAFDAIMTSMPECTRCSIPAKLGAAVRVALREAEHRRRDRRLDERRGADSVRREESLHRHCFATMLDGFALHELILDARGAPCDYRFLEVNPAFERITGLARAQVIGKTMRQAIPEIEPFWIETYGRVTLTGEPARFEHFSQTLDKYFEVVATRTARMQFSTVFRDVTDRRNSETVLNSMVEQNLAGIYIIQDGRIAYANPRFAEIFGYTPQDILVLPSFDALVAEQDRAMVRENVEKRIGGEIGARQYAIVGRRKDGSTVEIEAHGAPMEYQGGPAILGTMIDITERRRAESSLRESQQRQHALLDSIDDGAWLKDREGRYLEANRRVGRSIGANPADVVRKTDLDLYPATVAEEIRSSDRQVMETGTPLRFEHSVVRDGVTRWLEVVKVPVFDDHGTVVGTAGTSRDITERKQAHATLQRTEAYFRSLIENSADLITVLNLDQTIQYQSPSSERVTGHKPEEVVGHKFVEFVHPDDVTALAASFARNTQQSGPRTQVEFRHLHKDGSWRFLSAVGHTVVRDDGSKVMVANTRDITEQKLALQALRESEERYRSMFEAQRDAMALTDAETHQFIEVNQAFVALYGYSRNELLRMKGPDISAEARAGESFARDVVGAGPGQAIARRHRRKDGSELQVEISAVVTTLGGRKMYCAIIRDVSARVRDQERIANLTRLYATLSATNVTIVHARDRDALFREICRVAVEIGKFSLAWVGLIDPANQEIRPLVHHGEGQGHLASIRLPLDGTMHGPTFTAMVSGKVTVSNDFLNDSLTGPYYAAIAKSGFRSTAALPLSMDGKVIGVFKLYASKLGAFDAEQVRLLEEMATDISFALDSIDREQRRKMAEGELRKLSSAVEQSGSMVVITDSAGTIEYVNAGFERVTGYSAAEAIGQNPRMLKSDETSRSVHKDLWHTITGGREWHGEFHNRRKNGELYWSLVTINPLRDESGAVTHFVAVAEDATGRKEAQSTIERLAFFDSLTDLPNRRLFRDRLVQAIAASGRAGKHLAVMFLDLDRFKNVNDSLGHDAGDRLLKEVARRLVSATRSGDTVARLGGDEFALVLPNLQVPEDAGMVATKILNSLIAAIELDGHSIYATASIGISLAPGDSSDVDALIKNADIAMYQAKKRGNAFHYFTQELDGAALERLTLENDVRRGLERGEFIAHYQPQIDIASGRVIGMEALARWAKPGAGLVSPAKFIPLAEQTGLIVPIGEAILRAACEQAKQWQDAWVPPPTIAVNISARQFRESGFIDMVRRVLVETGLLPQCLELEVTESVVMKDVDETIRRLHELKQFGVRISIDDFGTGYSSLSYLKRFPIDKLKIDQSFVREVVTNGDDAAIVDAIISLAHSLRLKVIAEGVETAEQRQFLLEHGCEEAQGYHFARPMPGSEATRFIEEHSTAQPAR